MKRNNFGNYLLYGGVSKEEYDTIRPLVAEENHRVWKLVSIILEIAFIGLFVLAMIHPDYKDFTIGFGILAGTMILSVLAFLVLLKPQSKALLPFIYFSIIVILTVFGYIAIFVETNNPSAIFAVIIVGLSFVTLDKPIRYLSVQLAVLTIFITLICIFKKAFLLTDILVASLSTFAGILISLFISSIRVKDLLYRKSAEAARDIDALTSMNNKLAYDRLVSEVSKKMFEPNYKFAVMIFDVNGLKMTNDTYGHDQGDKLLVRCCNLIKQSLPNTPLFRIGGDEFAAIILGEDYANRERIIRELHENIDKAHEKASSLLDDTSIAIGVSTFNPKRDRDYLSVFSRADAEMYDNKRITKSKNEFLNGQE